MCCNQPSRVRTHKWRQIVLLTHLVNRLTLCNWHWNVCQWRRYVKHVNISNLLHKARLDFCRWNWLIVHKINLNRRRICNTILTIQLINFCTKKQLLTEGYSSVTWMTKWVMKQQGKTTEQDTLEYTVEERWLHWFGNTTMLVSSSSFYLFIKQFHKSMTADKTQTGPTRLAKHSQWPQ